MFSANASDRKLHVLLLALACVVAYSNTLGNGLVWDDLDFILKWDTPGKPGNIALLLKGEVPAGHEGVYRPVRSLFYMFAHIIYQGNPFLLHLQAILVHTVCTILAYLIILELVESGTSSFLGALVFAVHPVHTEAVSFITTSFDLFGVLFFLAAFLSYIKSGQGDGRHMASVILGVLGFFTYEMALTLPVLLVLYDLLGGRQVKKSVRKAGPHIIAAAAYLAVRFLVVDTSMRAGYPQDSILVAIILGLKAFYHYIRLLILPTGLTVNHGLSEGVYSFWLIDYEADAFAGQSILEPVVLAAAILLCLMAALAWKNRVENPVFTLGLSWIFITLLPVSQLIPLQALFGEKYLYLPSTGFSILIACMLDSSRRKSVFQARLYSILAAVILISCILFAVKTISRNRDWRDHESLWRSAVEKTPQSPNARYNLATGIRDNGRLDEALEEYMRVLELNPDFYEAHYNIGNIYARTGLAELALKSYHNALEINPGYSRARINLAIVYAGLGRKDLYLKHVEMVLEDEPANPYANNAMGLYSMGEDRVKQAEESFLKAISSKRDYDEAYNNLGVLYYGQNETEKAKYYFLKALENNPGNIHAKRNINTLAKEHGL